MTIVKVNDRILFGDIAACADCAADYAVVHACKEPCHRGAAGYTARSLDKNHPHYLSLRRGSHLYLNLIDPPVPLFQMESFKIFLSFMDEMAAADRPVLIHCNKGESRAPSLTLLYLAKRGFLPSESYVTARAAFAEKIPYKPGKGIEKFLGDNWATIG